MISVIIPTHNRCDLIARAVRSALSQTFKDIEVIVVSDGSNDDTPNVVAELTRQDVRVRFQGYEKPMGGNYARNTGARMARGEYIAFLDDDDEWYPEKLEKQMKALSDNPSAGLCYTGCHVVYINEKTDYDNIPTKGGDLSREILLGNCIGTTSTVVINKEVFFKAGAFDEKLPALQDYELWIRICQLCQVAVVSEPMIHYYNYRNGVQVSGSTSKYISAFSYIHNKHVALFDALSPEESVSQQLYEKFLIVNKAMRNNNGKEARAYIAKANNIKKTKKAVAFYVLSFFNYRTVLKFRKLVK